MQINVLLLYLLVFSKRNRSVAPKLPKMSTPSFFMFFFQVIYKKSQLPCPLPFFYGHSANLSMNSSDMSALYALPSNTTQMDFSRADVSSAILSGHNVHQTAGVHYQPHPSDEEMCTPKYFVFNSQVRREMRRHALSSPNLN